MRESYILLSMEVAGEKQGKEKSTKPERTKAHRLGLDSREVHPCDPTIQVQRIDVCHPRYVIQSTLDLAIGAGLISFVLATDSTEQGTAIEMIRVEECTDELIKELAKDTLTS